MISAKQPLRLLIVDDSPYNRKIISEAFSNRPEVEVVGKAGNGEEALKLATMLKPDVITLDLEMPKMDGFTFLRILMSRQPTPVIVVSSYAQRDNVFKALELGALDFVTKPSQTIAEDADELKQQIVARVLLVRQESPSLLAPNSRRLTSGNFAPEAKPPTFLPPSCVIAIGCSTGGPSALLDLFGRIPDKSAGALLIAQHMPDKFTRTFADRLDKKASLRAREATNGDKVTRGTAFVCPGSQCMEVAHEGKQIVLRVATPGQGDKYAPSIDRLFKSAAATFGAKSIGVVLTGMTGDAIEGARAIRDAGGTVIVESSETAVVYGMPGDVAKAGLATKELPLPDLAEELVGRM